jgi:hypothetical protein
MSSVRAILLLTLLTSVVSFLRLPPTIHNSPAIRGKTALEISPTKIHDWLSDTMPARFLRFLSQEELSKTQNRVAEKISSLASNKVAEVDHFVLDSTTVTEESIHLVSEIIQKSNSLEIRTDSPLVVNLLSQVSSLPTKKLHLSVKLTILPLFPALDVLTLDGSDGFENLAVHSESFKNMQFLSIIGARSVVFEKNTSDYGNLKIIRLNECDFVDIGNFYNKNIEKIVATDFVEVIVRQVIFEDDRPDSLFVSDPQSIFGEFVLRFDMTKVTLKPKLSSFQKHHDESSSPLAQKESIMTWDIENEVIAY